MREAERDPEVMSGIIRRRVLRAMVPAVKKLDRVARGMNRFAHDHERVACVVLARLAPLALASPVKAGDALDEQDEEWAARWLTPEKLALLEKLRAPSTREGNGEHWAQDFLNGGGMPCGIDTVEKAREYGRDWWDHCQAAGVRAKQTVDRVKRERRRR